MSVVRMRSTQLPPPPRSARSQRPTGRAGLVLAALALLVGTALTHPAAALGFSGFGSVRASETYGQQITFSVALPGGAPSSLELLLQFGDSPSSTFVAPVTSSGTSATYTWDASADYLTPNTPIDYRWRATDGGRTTLSGAGRIVYADNRPGLAWRSATIGVATVHWYGNNEAQARQFGQLSAGAVTRAEALLGHQLNGPIDIFVYVTQSDFFGALGPGAREWTGAATFPDIRTVFMWLGGGPASYLDTALVHEVTHVVFHDATTNPYHEPATWLNEGIATWSELQNADAERSTVQSEVSNGLFAIPALTGQFPIGSRGSSLSYAESTTLVDMIIRDYGRGALARIAAAYRQGATDAAALQAGTGIPAAQLYAAYYRSFGAAAPQPVKPASIAPSIVRTPASASSGGPIAAPSVSAQASGAAAPAPSGDNSPADALIVALLALVAAGGLVLAFWLYRRSGEHDG
jgi:Peptidase MA superfamily